LFYTRESCASLLKALLGDVMATRTLTDTAIATLQEIGNIIMVSCMSTISNMIEDDITFDIPDVTVEISEGYFQNLVREIKTLDHTIIVRNEMSIDATHVQGYIFVLLGFQDFVAVARDLAKKMQVNIGAGDEQNHE
jgi:chemotaxis protein CheY-P-specific phosphatase CheC